MEKLEAVQAIDIVVAVLTFGGFSLDSVLKKYGVKLTLYFLSLSLIAAYFTIIEVENVVFSVTRNIIWIILPKSSNDYLSSVFEQSGGKLLLLGNILLFCFLVYKNISQTEKLVLFSSEFVLSITRKFYRDTIAGSRVSWRSSRIQSKTMTGWNYGKDHINVLDTEIRKNSLAGFLSCFPATLLKSSKNRKYYSIFIYACFGEYWTGSCYFKSIKSKKRLMLTPAQTERLHRARYLAHMRRLEKDMKKT